MKKINGSSAVLRIVAAFLLAPTVLLGCELELDDKDSRSVIAGFNATDLTISGQATSFEVKQEFSFGDGAVITAKYSDESTKTLSASDVSVSFFSETDQSYFTDFTNAKANDTVVVIAKYKSGSVTCEYQYEVSITNAVKSIEIKSVDKAYVYNPGALDFAIDNAIATAFAYKVTATYIDDSTDDNFAANCTFAPNADKTGVVATYKDLTDEYSSEDIKNAITSFAVDSGYSVTGAWWTGHTANMAVPAGKTVVATLKYNGTGANSYIPVLKFTNGDATITDGTQDVTEHPNYKEYAIFQGSSLYGWCGTINTNAKGDLWKDVTVTWGENGVPDNSVLINADIPYKVTVKNSSNGSTFDFTISLTGTDDKEYTGTVANIPGGTDLNFGFCCDSNVTLTFD